MNNSSSSKRFIRISNDSGCFLANYSSPRTDEESIVIRFEDNNEISGSFKFPAIKRK